MLGKLNYLLPFVTEVRSSLPSTDLARGKRAGFWHGRGQLGGSQKADIATLEEYLSLLEEALSDIVRKRSIAYWLHWSRRTLAIAFGPDNAPATRDNVRSTFEAAVQRVAVQSVCDGLGRCGDTDPSRILGGNISIEFCRKLPPDSIVLVDTTQSDVVEFLRAMALSYEIWLAMARKRAIAKGAGAALASAPPPDYYRTERSTELQFLLASYDRRSARIWSTEAGVVYSLQGSSPDTCWFPSANTDRSEIVVDDLYQAMLGLPKGARYVPGFNWHPFPVRRFLDSQEFFFDAFRARYCIQFENVVGALVAIALHCMSYWPRHALSLFEHGYWGPWERARLIREAVALRAHVETVLRRPFTDESLRTAISFWSLQETPVRVDVQLGDNHCPIMPYDESCVFVDFSWAARRLQSLTRGLHLGGGDKLKSESMETILRDGRDLGRGKKLKATDGTIKQIDAAFDYGDALVIVEAKAITRRPGFDWGNPESIQERTRRAVCDPLSQIDDKAQWLSERPKGRNYDYSRFKWIVPLVASPFVEYIPSMERRYWLTQHIPRVLTISEIHELLAEPSWSGRCFNTVLIRGAV